MRYLGLVLICHVVLIACASCGAPTEGAPTRQPAAAGEVALHEPAPTEQADTTIGGCAAHLPRVAVGTGPSPDAWSLYELSPSRTLVHVADLGATTSPPAVSACGAHVAFPECARPGCINPDSNTVILVDVSRATRRTFRVRNFVRRVDVDPLGRRVLVLSIGVGRREELSVVGSDGTESAAIAIGGDPSYPRSIAFDPRDSNFALYEDRGRVLRISLVNGSIEDLGARIGEQSRFSVSDDGSVLAYTGETDQWDRHLRVWGPNNDVRLWDRDRRVERALPFPRATAQEAIFLGQGVLVQFLVLTREDGSETQRDGEGDPVADPSWAWYSLYGETTHPLLGGTHSSISR